MTIIKMTSAEFREWADEIGSTLVQEQGFVFRAVEDNYGAFDVHTGAKLLGRVWSWEEVEGVCSRAQLPVFRPQGSWEYLNSKRRR